MKNEEINKYGEDIDFALDNKDVEKLHEIISIIQNKLEEDIPSGQKCILYYYLGNAWSSIDSINNKKQPSSWEYKNVEFDKYLICLRMAITYIDEKTDKNLICMINTNLGNAFSQSGRPIQAIGYWNSALKINHNFSMANGNLGYGLSTYAGMLYDHSHRDIIGREAFFYLSKVSPSDAHSAALSFFQEHKKALYEYFGEEYLNQQFEDKEEYKITGNDDEIRYWKWVLSKKLFLNPLNDIFVFDIVAHDVLSLPSMIVPADHNVNDPLFHKYFNIIKQEYITLRYYYYLYSQMEEHETHFSDNLRHLTNTLDYPQFGLKYEYLKMSFRMAYSIFDKIAFFLNKYLDLNIPDHKVNYNNIWYIKNKKEINIRQELIDLKNLPLRGLFFLSRDFYEKNTDFMSSLEPDARKVAEIRNFIEHKGLQISWNIASNVDKSNSIYTLGEDELALKTFSIISKCREAIIYLSLAIHHEEKKKDNEGLIMPINMIEYDF